jgi:hypothetical protein
LRIRILSNSFIGKHALPFPVLITYMGGWVLVKIAFEVSRLEPRKKKDLNDYETQSLKVETVVERVK